MLQNDNIPLLGFELFASVLTVTKPTGFVLAMRRILRISWIQRKTKTNISVLEKLGVKKSPRADVISRKLSYFGHTTRHQCPHKDIIQQGMIEGRRRRGRPSWINDIKIITEKSTTEVTRAASDRRQWRFTIGTTPALIYAT